MEKEYEIVIKIPDKSLQELKHTRQNPGIDMEENLEGAYTERGIYSLFRRY